MEARAFMPDSPDQVPLGLVGAEVLVPVRGQVAVVLHRDRDGAAAVFGDRRRRAELDGAVGAVPEVRVPLRGRGQVHVACVDRRTKGVTMVADRVRVQAGKEVDPFQLGRDGERGFPPGHPGTGRGGECLVYGVRVSQRGLQPFGDVVLTVAQDVGDLLPVAGEAQVVETAVEVDDVAPLEDEIVRGRVHVGDHFTGRLVEALDRDVDLEPGLAAHTQLGDGLVEEPLDVLRAGLAGCDHDVGKGGLGDDVGGEDELAVGLELAGQAGVEDVLDERRGGHEARFRHGAEGVGEEPVAVVGQAAVVPAVAADGEADRGGIVPFPERLQTGRRVLDATGVARSRNGLEEAAVVRGGTPVVGVRGEPVVTAVDEDHDIAAARVLERWCDMVERRILVELLTHDEPHLDPVFAHLVEEERALVGEPFQPELVLRAHAQQFRHGGDDAAVEEFDGVRRHGGACAGGHAVRRGARGDQGCDGGRGGNGRRNRKGGRARGAGRGRDSFDSCRHSVFLRADRA